MRKRIAVLLLAVTMVFLSMGCGEQKKESAYAQALDVLNAVVESYSADELFAMYGGDQENAVMDAPGTFDITKAEELKTVLGLPNSQLPVIANTFTGAAYRLKADTDLDAFAEAVRESVLATQWMCGIPDTLLMIDVDGTYVITAYGEAGIMDTFKNKALSALDGSEILLEESIACYFQASPSYIIFCP